MFGVRRRARQRAETSALKPAAGHRQPANGAVNAQARPARAPPADRSSYNFVNWGPALASETAAGPLRLSDRPSQWHLSRATGISYP